MSRPAAVFMLIASTALLSGCGPELRRFLAAGHVVMLVVCSALTLIGLLALRSAMRDLKLPGRAGRAALNSVTAIFTLMLPAYLLAIYGDGNESLAIAVIAGLVAFSLMLLFMFVLAIVRWVRGR